VKSYWLQSYLRQSFLTYKFYNLPILQGKKPIADVYLTLNDPHSFILLQALTELEKNVDLTFNLHLVSGTNASQTESLVQFRESTLKDASYLSDKFGLVKAQLFPTVDNLITGQQIWFLKVKTLEDALKVFNDTWFGNYTEHYALSTPVITAQINNRRKLMKKGHSTSGIICFCGSWFAGVENLEAFKSFLSSKGLLKNADELKHNVDEVLLSKSMLNQDIKNEVKPPLLFKNPAINYSTFKESSCYTDREAS